MLTRRLIVAALLGICLMMIGISDVHLAVGQDNGPSLPDYIVTKSAEASNLQISVRTETSLLMAGQPARAVFEVTTTQAGEQVPISAYVILINIDPDGTATVIYPYEGMTPLGNFVNAGQAEFVPSGEGRGFLQGFALTTPIGVEPGTEDRAGALIPQMVDQIRRTSISEFAWDAGWHSHDVTEILPMSSHGDGELFVHVRENNCQDGRPLHDALVIIDGDAPQPAWRIIPVPSGRREVSAELRGYLPNPRSVTVPVRAGGPVSEPCLRMVPGNPIVTWHPAVPTVRDLITFDASRFRPYAEYYLWNFDDNHSQGGEDAEVVTHRYQASGTYNPSVTMSFSRLVDCTTGKPLRDGSYVCSRSFEVPVQPFNDPPVIPDPFAKLTVGESGETSSLFRTHIGPTNDFKISFDFQFTQFDFTWDDINLHGMLEGQSYIQVRATAILLSEERELFNRRIYTLLTPGLEQSWRNSHAWRPHSASQDRSQGPLVPPGYPVNIIPTEGEPFEDVEFTLEELLTTDAPLIRAYLNQELAAGNLERIELAFEPVLSVVHNYGANEINVEYSNMRAESQRAP